MNRTTNGISILVMLAAATAACDRPPTRDIRAAELALESATSEGAPTYASAEYHEAAAAQARLGAEVANQEGRWAPSYDRARTLALTASQTAESAVTATATAKMRRRDEASVLIAEAAATREQVVQRINGTSPETVTAAREAITEELDRIGAALSEATELLSDEHYAQAQSLADMAKESLLALIQRLDS